jgi:hypothetical protein
VEVEVRRVERGATSSRCPPNDNQKQSSDGGHSSLPPLSIYHRHFGRSREQGGDRSQVLRGVVVLAVYTWKL